MIAPRAIASEMATAAAAFLEALDAEQRPVAALSFEDAEARRDWGYFPRGFRGLPLLRMAPQQAKRAHALVAAGLSLHAYARVNAIIALEQVLDEIEGRLLTQVRDPGRYFLAIFGEPGNGPWSWRFEGHHVSLNFTLAGGDVLSATPIFLGANPSEVLHGSHAVTQPCAEEEDIGRELLRALDAEQRVAAMLCDIAPPDFVLMNAPLVPETCLPGDLRPMQQIRYDHMTQAQLEALRFERAAPRGLPASRMNARQRALLDALIGVYIERLPDVLAQAARARIYASDIEQMQFAWAGGEKRRDGHYYRLQGRRFLVEYDNTQDGANHVHAVWRDAANDFGEDMLRAHLRAAH